MNTKSSARLAPGLAGRPHGDIAAARLLERLEGIRSVGHGRWIARCPAHQDRSPSLSIRELDDGRVLIHDFAGCPASSVLGAVGLELKDLYPDGARNHAIGGRKPKHWHAAPDALRVLQLESLVVVIAAENLAQGVVLAKEDHARLVVAAARIRAAAEACE